MTNRLGIITRAGVCLWLAAGSVGLLAGHEVLAQTATTSTAGVDAVRPAVEDFWHYAKVARYDLAVQSARKVLDSGSQPLDVLLAFEAVSTARKDDLDSWTLRWAQVEELRGPMAEILSMLNLGREARAADPAFIRDNIDRLIVNERAFSLAVGRLRLSGELAVPMMVGDLRDPAKSIYHPAIRRALVSMGKPVLNPLVEATRMQDQPALLQVVEVLGDLGYDAAAPYLAKLAESPGATSAVKDATSRALGKLNASGTQAGSGYLALAEKFYAGTSAITSQTNAANEAYVWTWDEKLGLTKKNVPTVIYNEVMAMRSARSAIDLTDATQPAPVSMWLASNFKREAELPTGAADPTIKEGTPDAHYFGVASGAQYLNSVLARAVSDRDTAVALRSIAALKQVAGNSALLAEKDKTPLVDALTFPEKLVRFDAAFALASARPTTPFIGQDAVVPVLAEAMAQTGKSGVLVLASSMDQINGMTQALTDAGYSVEGATTAEGLIASSGKLAAVDVVLAFESAGTSEIDKLLAASATLPRMERTPKLIVTNTPGSPFVARAATDTLVTATQTTDASALVQELLSARKRGGASPMDAESATAYALKAATHLYDLAVMRNSVLQPVVAEPALLAALDDARPELVKLSADVLALLPTSAPQPALLGKATAKDVAADVRIHLYRSLANSAKSFGNQLNAAQVEELRTVALTEADLNVRSAAAEALGALNLPADQARQIILGDPTTAAQ